MELLRDRGREFEEAGVRIAAVSRDSPWSHVAWMQALDLNFTLLSDRNGEAVRGFGVARDYRGMDDVARRSAFLIERGVKAGDHLQTIWQLWLPGHQLRRGERLWIDPYSFQPEVEPRINFAGWPFSIVFGPLEWALGTVLAWNVFVLLGYLGAGGLAFLWLRALERRWYWLSTAALASIPLSGQVHLALGAIPFFAAYALVGGGDRRWAGGAVGGSVVAGLAVWALSIRGSIGDSRSFAQVERYSADLADFVARDPRHGLEPYVFVGWLVPLLAVAAVAVRRSLLAGLLAAGALVPMVLALGANLPGYEALWDAVPGLGATRVPGRLMPIACLSLAGLAALAAARARWRWAPLLLIALVAVDLRAGVTAYEPAAADEHNRAYAALREHPGGRLLEMPVRAPDRQEASVYLYYAMQAPRERPAGYSTIAPKKAARVLRELRPCADARHLSELGVRYLAVVGRPECGVAGRLLARDGPVALYEAYIPLAW